MAANTHSHIDGIRQHKGQLKKAIDAAAGCKCKCACQFGCDVQKCKRAITMHWAAKTRKKGLSSNEKTTKMIFY